MKILLVDADSKIPNLALMKLSTYHKSLGDTVTLLRLNIPYYPHKKKTLQTIPFGFDKVYCSVIFPGSLKYIDYHNIENVYLGGTGYPQDNPLPIEIENLDPDYSIYPDNDISYGFITRGCTRNCSFCVVRQKEGNIKQVSTVDKIVKHKFVRFLDNNILSHPEHKVILQELIDKKIKCEFYQGLDIRLIDEENSVLLSKLRYYNERVFAFDDWKYKPILDKKIPILQKWAKEWRLKFFVYVHPDMPLKETVDRIQYLRERKCYPYIMRDISCYGSFYHNFYTDLAAWCNQPGFFKHKEFDEFVTLRCKETRAKTSIKLYEENL